MLQADMHMHTNRDPEDSWITHTPEQLIDHAAALGFDVLSITHHRRVIFEQSWARRAKKLGMLLIPGTEARIEGKDILLYNFTPKEVYDVRVLSDLNAYAKRRDRLIVAAHPFYPIPSLRDGTHSCGLVLQRIKHVVDAVEYCHFYARLFNGFNRLAVWAAGRYGLPVVANSDSHALSYMGSNYTLINANKDVRSIFAAIRAGKIKIVTRPRTSGELFKLGWNLLSPKVLKKLVAP
ncbi:PHP domain-containing protein [Candidatus Woesearchaeota archaeon]|nr:PHP domain-containing protein [Candidatus Woesearchaeota archaeon]